MLRFSLVLYIILVLTSCSSKHNIDIQGHRGCRGLFPENSLPAFEKAIDLGVHTLELDIAITKDKKVVVSHEPFMNQAICLKPDGAELNEAEDMLYNFYEMTHQQIRNFDCGTKFHKGYPNQKKLSIYKPLLSEVFDLVKRKHSQVKFNIEIKSKPQYYGTYTPYPKEYVRLVLGAIKNSELQSRVNLQSFDLVILEEIKVQSTNMPVALLVDEDEKISEKRLKLSYKPEIISPYYKLLDEKKVKSLQSEGFKVIPWTINSEPDMQQMINFKVDGIITDYPDRLIKLLE